eukprot:TRINITY_DN68056_c0_g1_i1.p1 TRINITY_DN68056_c0_g1~~TRINITY_DN68056_c0_g1_i1.p1  ORF type:complete len:211 (+),score=52.22 TRINITY_DN68056_c0_g1_i1:119-751(+)
MQPGTAAAGSKFKVVLLGETGVGKSSIVFRLLHDEFMEQQKSTVGASFLHYSVPLQDCLVNLDIWDTAGQERYRGLAKMYYRGASAAIVVYDITSSGSFERAKEWVTELNEQCGTDQNLVVVLAGNKLDLVEEEPSCRRVLLHDVQQYAQEHSIYAIETSAKESSNVEELFVRLAHQLATHIPPTPAHSEMQPSPQLKRAQPSTATGCCR